jgi:hypothetical protein
MIISLGGGLIAFPRKNGAGFSACNEFKTGFCLIVKIEFNKLIVSLSVILLVVVEAADWRRFYKH